MIVTLEGTLTAASHTFAIVDVGGVGLRAFIPTSTAAQLPSIGERVRLFTHLHVREDDLSLYGFSTAGELELFEQLLSVSGLGPTKSLAIISGSPVDAIRTYIWTENTAALAKVPGVGARTAARIVLDLKSKIGPVSATKAAGVVPGVPSSVDGEVLSWLTTLGFAQADVHAALAQLPRDVPPTFEDRAREALALLRRG